MLMPWKQTLILRVDFCHADEEKGRRGAREEVKGIKNEEAQSEISAAMTISCLVAFHQAMLRRKEDLIKSCGNEERGWNWFEEINIK